MAIGTIKGIAAIFDSPSEDIGFIEEIDRHAFDRVLAAKPDVRCMFNHDPNNLLGRTASGTVRLSVDSRGLQYVCDLPDTSTGREVKELVNRRDITGSSFGFICGRDQWDVRADGRLTRRILEVADLFDASPVTVPAYAATEVATA